MDADKIGACIRMAMAKKKRSASWLGGRMEVSRQTASSWCNGSCTDIIKLGEIAAVLDMTFEEMMALAD